MKEERLQEETIFSTATAYLIRVQAPKFELFLKQWPAHIRWIVKFACPIIVEYLTEDARVTIEKVLAHEWVIIGKRLSETRQSSGRYFLERSLLVVVDRREEVRRTPEAVVR